MATVRWREMPDEVKGALAPYLTRWLLIVPGWCEEIIVEWDADEHSATMRTDVRMEYRDTILQVCPPWLDLPPAAREETLVHELAHILTGPLVNFTRSTIRDISEAGTPLRAVLTRECENAYEGVVEDLARAFVRLRAAS